VDNSEEIKIAKQFANTAYTTALEAITKEINEKLIALRTRAAANGTLHSGSTISGAAKLHGERISRLLDARLEGILEGYELYGVPLDEERASRLLEIIMHDRETLLEFTRTPDKLDIGILTPDAFQSLVDGECDISRASIRLKIERRMMKKNPSNVTQVFHLAGNARVNTNSVDQSVNVVMSSSEEIFANLREVITSGVQGDEKAEILARLSDLEAAQKSPSVLQLYTEFIAVAANHMTLIAPFIPALTEMLHKV
jgi:hypothetical protein